MLLFTRSVIWLIAVALHTPAQAQPASPAPVPPVVAAITADGQIIYYSRMEANIPDAEELRWDFEGAVKENIGMKEFIENNPAYYLAAGSGSVVYALTDEELSQGNYAAKPVGAIPAAGGTGRIIEEENFL